MLRPTDSKNDVKREEPTKTVLCVRSRKITETQRQKNDVLKSHIQNTTHRGNISTCCFRHFILNSYYIFLSLFAFILLFWLFLARFDFAHTRIHLLLGVYVRSGQACLHYENISTNISLHLCSPRYFIEFTYANVFFSLVVLLVPFFCSWIYMFMCACVCVLCIGRQSINQLCS